MRRKNTLPFFLIIAFIIQGCAARIPDSALVWDQETMKERSLQTRRFDTTDETMVLQSVSGLLQDLGFSLDESETKLGILVGSKDRDATDPGQIIGAILFAALTGVATAVDERQKIRASVVTAPVKDGTAMTVRVTFQRLVWNTQGRVSRAEPLNDPESYQEFFSKLSKSIFLEAHEI